MKNKRKQAEDSMRIASSQNSRGFPCELVIYGLSPPSVSLSMTLLCWSVWQ